MGATTSSVSFGDSPRTIQSYLRLAFAALLALLTWSAFHDAYGNVPIVTDVSTAIISQNLIIPAGTAKMGAQEYPVKINSSTDTVTCAPSNSPRNRERPNAPPKSVPSSFTAPIRSRRVNCSAGARPDKMPVTIDKASP